MTELKAAAARDDGEVAELGRVVINWPFVSSSRMSVASWRGHSRTRRQCQPSAI